MPELYDNKTGKAYPILDSEIFIGRHVPEGHLKVGKAYETISREHAKVFTEDGEFFLTDLSSKSGTQLNGKRIDPNSPAKLTYGSIIKLAKIGYAIEFREGGEGPADSSDDTKKVEVDDKFVDEIIADK